MEGSKADETFVPALLSRVIKSIIKKGADTIEIDSVAYRFYVTVLLLFSRKLTMVNGPARRLIQASLAISVAIKR